MAITPYGENEMTKLAKLIDRMNDLQHSYVSMRQSSEGSKDRAYYVTEYRDYVDQVKDILFDIGVDINAGNIIDIQQSFVDLVAHGNCRLDVFHRVVA